MSKVDWSLAPEGAEFYSPPFRGLHACWYKDVDGEVYLWCASEPHWSQREEMIGELVERPQPKPWSGPEDGLPPLGIEFEWRYGDTEWKKGEALYIGEIYVILKSIHGGEQHYYLRNMEFRAIPTPDQKRETAIRELMDIAQVDCRVTAARLVDAGFKREVV